MKTEKEVRRLLKEAVVSQARCQEAFEQCGIGGHYEAEEKWEEAVESISEEIDLLKYILDDEEE